MYVMWIMIIICSVSGHKTNSVRDAIKSYESFEDTESSVIAGEESPSRIYSRPSLIEFELDSLLDTNDDQNPLFQEPPEASDDFIKSNVFDDYTSIINVPVFKNGILTGKYRSHMIIISNIAKFSPVLHFHPNEQYFPTSIEKIIHNSQLYFNQTFVTSKVTQDILSEDKYHNLNPSTLAYLNINSSEWKSIYMTQTPPAYVTVQAAINKEGTDYNLLYNYIFIYGYNGLQIFDMSVNDTLKGNTQGGFSNLGTHQGDVEWVGVLTDKYSTKILGIMNAHDGIESWTFPDIYGKFPKNISIIDGHPHFGVALFSHASYPFPSDAKWNTTIIPISPSIDASAVLPTLTITPISIISSGGRTLKFDEDQLIFANQRPDGSSSSDDEHERWVKYGGRLGKVREITSVTAPYLLSFTGQGDYLIELLTQELMSPGVLPALIAGGIIPASFITSDGPESIGAINRPFHSYQLRVIPY